MTTRGRSYGQGNEWDIMQDEFNNSSHDPDDDLNNRVHLDHCRLYIRNIPKALSDEGLRTAFSKYGTLTEVHLSKDPLKKYALVRFETPGEAKLAMTKLNNTEPLKLNITIANKPKKRQDNPSRDSMDRSFNGPAMRSNRDDNTSVSSKEKSFRRHDEMPNGEELEDLVVGSVLDEDMDSDIKMQHLQLELQRLQVQEQTVLLKQQMFQLETARKKNLTQTTPSNRCILPDGRIVVRNVDRSLECRDVEGSFAAGAGDSLTIPALQRVASRACVACGSPADAYCARCGLTPYCTSRCQRKDWVERHRAVCHNLARLAGKTDVLDQTLPDIEPVIPPAAPLRRPHSPVAAKREQIKRDDDQDDIMQKKTSPSMTNFKKQDRQDNRQENKSRSNNDRGNFRNNKTNYNNNKPNRMPRQDSLNDAEDFGNKNTTAAPTPVTETIAAPAPKPLQMPKTTKPEPQTVEEPKVQAVMTNGSKPPGSVNDVTPAKKLVPKNYLIEMLSIGDSVLLSVDAKASDCRSKKDGYICLSMHEKYETEYQALCEAYVVDCEADTSEYKPKIGETFSYLNPEDGGWYRARLLTPTLAALLDASRLRELASDDKIKRLTDKYHMPEFCCVLQAEAEIGNNLKCSLVAKSGEGYKVSIESVEGGTTGEGEISRWLPDVEYPAPAPVASTANISIQPQIPEVPRPDVTNNSKVLLVDATAVDRLFVRAENTDARRRFDSVLEQVLLYGRNATPIKEPPNKGQVVIAKFSDGLHYRALCKRTSVKQNKYLLEYIEFGNTEITTLDNIYACPSNLDLSAIPTESSLVTLQVNCQNAFTPPAVEYLDKLKDTEDELELTIPSGAKTAASGSAVLLTIAKNKESINKKIEQMCTPEWKKIEERGGDVVDTKPLMYSDLEYLELPADGCSLEVLDMSALEAGSVCACRAGLPHAARVLGNLTDRMGEYCNSELGKEPYLPKHEELCIAQFPPYPQWFRAVLLEQTPGSATARVCYLDYGNVEEVGVDCLRKMLPEFVKGEPALASHLEIKDFPDKPTAEMLGRAIEYMQINDEGRGKLEVTRCIKQEGGLYVVHAPGLIKAMTGK